jgi:hypothetical protein
VVERCGTGAHQEILTTTAERGAQIFDGAEPCRARYFPPAVRVRPRARHAITDPTETADRIDPTHTNEPIEPIDPNEPIEPIDRTEPVEPIDKTEPFDHMLRTEPSDRYDIRDGRFVVMPRSSRAGRTRARKARDWADTRDFTWPGGPTGSKDVTQPLRWTTLLALDFHDVVFS